MHTLTKAGTSEEIFVNCKHRNRVGDGITFLFYECAGLRK